MAAATKYYYNRAKVQITVQGDDQKFYYMPPRAFYYLPIQLATGAELPSSVLTFDLPAWWKPDYWPKAKPWQTSYEDWPNRRT